MPDTRNEHESGLDLEPADAFAALGNPIRVAILRAFLEHAQEGPAEPVVRFSTLRKAVGIRDSGRFRYHLEQLRGQFVEKCDEDTGVGADEIAGGDADVTPGYRLTYAGSEVINAIIAGTYTDRERRGPAALESTCNRCGTTAHASYRDGVLEVTCENDHPLFLWTLPPNAAAGASLEAIVDLATTLAVQSYELVADGTCSECYSPVEPGIRLLDEIDTDNGAGTTAAVDGRSARFTARCDACGAQWDAPVGFVLFTHPRVESLYHRQGRPIRSQYWWDLEVVSGDGTVAILEGGDEPRRVRLTVDVDGAQVCATIDDAAQVVDLEIDQPAAEE